MTIQLRTIPILWNGTPVGVARKNEQDPGIPRDLASFLVQALSEAHTAGFLQDGQPRAEDPKVLLVRASLWRKIETAGQELEITPEELDLVQRCVAATFREPISVPLMGALHSSIQGDSPPARGVA
jgi:hypothetical protein